MSLDGLTLRGVHGRIDWEYAEAAVIQGYAVTRIGEAWSLRATAVRIDRFRLRQRPLMFVARHARGAWMFPIEQIVDVQGQTVTARLGAPLETRDLEQ